MTKNQLNYLIDIIMYILMMAILGIGLMMKYVLITGEERWIKYGKNLEMFIWGMDRHEWGRIHLILGLALIAFLILHLILHWKSIVRFFRCSFTAPVLRYTIVTALLIISALLVIFPFFMKVSFLELEPGYGRRRWSSPGIKPETSNVIPQQDPQKTESSTERTTEPETGKEDLQEPEYRRRELAEDIEIRGYMTLQEVAQEYGVSVDLLKEKLDLPLNTPDDERLGRLRNWYGITMSDVRDAICELQINQEL